MKKTRKKWQSEQLTKQGKDNQHNEENLKKDNRHLEKNKGKNDNKHHEEYKEKWQLAPWKQQGKRQSEPWRDKGKNDNKHHEEKKEKRKMKTFHRKWKIVIFPIFSSRLESFDWVMIHTAGEAGMV